MSRNGSRPPQGSISRTPLSRSSLGLTDGLDGVVLDGVAVQRSRRRMAGASARQTRHPSSLTVWNLQATGALW